MTAAASIARRRSARRIPRGLATGLLLLLALLMLALRPDLLAPYDPLTFDYGALLQPPSLAHPFGTDNFGRDVLSRVIWATRIDLQIALFGTLFPLVFGTAVGAFVGYRGGWLDTVFGRIVDVVITFPFLVLVIAIIAVLGPGLFNMYIAVSSVGWVFYARLMRSEILVQKQADYASAARIMGYSTSRILFRHLLPNAITPVIVFWMTDMALVILLGASLGYLGLGALPPTPEWGLLVADGKNFMSTGWWMSMFPGAAVVIAGISFSLIGDGLADLLRPRGR
ncbi:MAG: ABC transporter permease [Proteobacteria bacterium]|nr:ABC transporter permease [Pseudomonadota bacterium]